MKQDKSTTAASYPQSFHPKALWCTEEICGYLHIRRTYYHEIEMLIPTFKVGQRRVAYAEDVMAYADRRKQEQNPLSGRPLASLAAVK